MSRNTKKKPRLDRLNRLPRLKRPNGAPITAYEEHLVIRSRSEAEHDPDGLIAERRYERIFSDSGPDEDLEKMLSEIEERARRIFTQHEGDPESKTIRAGWNAYGRWGHCRTKYGNFACDLLQRITQYRRLAEEKPDDHQSYRLIQIGRLSMLIELLPHEENASLGAERRRLNSKGGKERKMMFTRLLIEEKAEEEVNKRVDKGYLSLTECREIAASQIKPAWRTAPDAPTIHPDTLRRRKIGRKEKKPDSA